MMHGDDGADVFEGVLPDDALGLKLGWTNHHSHPETYLMGTLIRR